MKLQFNTRTLFVFFVFAGLACNLLIKLNHYRLYGSSSGDGYAILTGTDLQCLELRVAAGERPISKLEIIVSKYFSTHDERILTITKDYEEASLVTLLIKQTANDNVSSEEEPGVIQLPAKLSGRHYQLITKIKKLEVDHNVGWGVDFPILDFKDDEGQRYQLRLSVL